MNPEYRQRLAALGATFPEPKKPKVRVCKVTLVCRKLETVPEGTTFTAQDMAPKLGMDSRALAQYLRRATSGFTCVGAVQNRNHQPVALWQRTGGTVALNFKRK